jgi:Xaa-Pro aminopeptidase
MLDPKHSLSRQKRLLGAMQRTGADAAVIGNPQHVYYFSAHYTNWLHCSAFILFSDGRSWLISANQPARTAAADEVVSYEAQWHATLRQEQPRVVAERIHTVLKAHKCKRIGVDASVVNSQVAVTCNAECSSIDHELWQMRRAKDDDELALLKTAIAASEAMYQQAREMIAPGVEELDVYRKLDSIGVKTLGEPYSDLLGNDFTCGGGGGPPRKGHVAHDGEIYILDLGPAYRGYFADNCRAFAVNKRPTDVQMKAWDAIVGALKIVEQLAKPRAKCRDIFDAVDEHLRDSFGQRLKHHLGHGIGLQPHEFPHLNPKWDDELMEGEVFAAEPGLYGPELAGGIRIENNYLVTSTGVENLLHFPMDL